jgi:16S rRNA (uracil1498-N3)-methyltransferase
MVQRITISADQQQGSSLITLRGDQVHYLMRVLRLKVGDRFIAQTGQGQQWLAALSEQAHQAQILEALAPNLQPSPPLRLIAALPKGNSFDQVVRQTTELGVTHIYPVITERTLLKPKGNKLERWRRIAQEASEQSERITVPEIFDPADFISFIKQTSWEGGSAGIPTDLSADQRDDDELRYLCAARAQSPHLLAHLLTHQPNEQPSQLTCAHLPSVILAVGPEGGWTPNEITVATAHGYKVVSLGGAILRAVTAPITALSLVAAARELLI